MHELPADVTRRRLDVVSTPTRRLWRKPPSVWAWWWSKHNVKRSTLLWGFIPLAHFTGKFSSNCRGRWLGIETTGWSVCPLLSHFAVQIQMNRWR